MTERRRFEHVSIPPHLLDDIVRGDCVLFMGAGASTEGKGTSYWSDLLVDDLVKECGYPSTLPKTLPEVAQYYCRTLDASRKGRLVRQIRDRISRFMNIPEAYFTVTICHSIVATIPYFRVIVTTNWDPFMERTANIIPIVRDTDMAYWNDSSRQVLKMHGCIADPSTMVITSSDYEEYLKTRIQSAICNKLRDLMSTKTFLFIGYGLADTSFETIHNDILTRMGQFARTSFAVVPEATDKDTELWKTRGVTMIDALAFPFLEELRNKLIDAGAMFEVDREIKTVSKEREKMADTHMETSAQQERNVGLLSSMYQDGLQHGLDTLEYGLRLGVTREQLEADLRNQQMTLASYRESDNEFRDTEIAYCTGRVRCIEWFLSENRTSLLPYFSAKLMEPASREEFQRELDEEIIFNSARDQGTNSK
jgi:hypothetical protein